MGEPNNNDKQAWINNLKRKQMYVTAHQRCSGDLECIANYTKIPLKIVIKMERDERVSRMLTSAYKNMPDDSDNIAEFTVSKADRMKLLWHIANKCTDTIYDMEGNVVMANPTVSVSAIRALNDMIAGSLVSKNIDLNVVVEDKRTELEIEESVKSLMNRYKELNVVNNSVMPLPAIEHEK